MERTCWINRGAEQRFQCCRRCFPRWIGLLAPLFSNNGWKDDFIMIVSSWFWSFAFGKEPFCDQQKDGCARTTLWQTGCSPTHNLPAKWQRSLHPAMRRCPCQWWRCVLRHWAIRYRLKGRCLGVRNPWDQWDPKIQLDAIYMESSTFFWVIETMNNNNSWESSSPKVKQLILCTRRLRVVNPTQKRPAAKPSMYGS